MVRRAIADRVPFRWVTADAAYGFSKSRRFELERADVFHVMAETPFLRRRCPRPADL
ncbi:hypothetical protein GCM10010317_054100 [Streptomyces mirabilis]|jgi:SRSO17 transposase|nr:hypothetical protein GCM10010317_054100 [Streptomyces mirabilis]